MSPDLKSEYTFENELGGMLSYSGQLQPSSLRAYLSSWAAYRVNAKFLQAFFPH